MRNLRNKFSSYLFEHKINNFMVYCILLPWIHIKSLCITVYINFTVHVKPYSTCNDRVKPYSTCHDRVKPYSTCHDRVKSYCTLFSRIDITTLRAVPHVLSLFQQMVKGMHANSSGSSLIIYTSHSPSQAPPPTSSQHYSKFT